MDGLIADFVSFTQASPERAAQYLHLADNNLEQAVELFFESPNLDLGTTATSQESSSTAQQPAATTTNASRPDLINLDSDDDMMDFGADSDNPTPAPAASHAANTAASGYESDEAMARRLQEEMYGAGAATEDIRAPMARTTETLVGPGATWTPADDDMDAMVAEQMAARRRPGRPGIFNQRPIQPSVWDHDSGDPTARRRDLSLATAGASDSSTKSSLLAEMYRPPFELMCQLPWDDARDQGKDSEKWLLVNIQDPAIFDCQVLNRDIWKNDQVKDTVKENFLFMQYAKDDHRGNKYIQYYFHARDSGDAYPHIAIVDPRTGEQVKVWSGPPVPKPMDFLMQLHEFLDRYSLKANARNPVANRKPERKKMDVDRMTEEEMLEMALQNSIDNAKGPKDDDPDALTKEPGGKGKGKAVEDDGTEPAGPIASNSVFSQISTTNPHTEPQTGPTITRIQFRDSNGKRQVRRFDVSDPVRRLYEWLKAAPWEEDKAGVEFELIFMGKNLIEGLDKTIQEAGLKNGSVNVEFVGQSDE
ncbi:UBX domain-containing protein 7 [Mytilinidion resinicola]|uniref:UBX domain-containing protein 7 n=1 Tax=Mytilinidion resinicola TaxID=574789 RepID=A0A6A6YNN2_9PEZI|nr:UBX domain-containing protein 7 [Mytilinidion resinicola]KAF2810351.1 UBX domain-containing protein 7 [Mytilinidion resinicola]